MKQTTAIRAIILMMAGLMTACATGPVTPPAMPAEAYAALIQEIEGQPRPLLAIKEISETLEEGGVSDAQRVDLYWRRAQLRRDHLIDMPAALVDIQRASELNADEDRRGALSELGTDIANKIELHRARLEGLQTLSAWFDDKVALGEMGPATERFRSTGLSPSEAQVGLLRDAGLICAGGTAGAGGKPIHDFDEPPAYAADLVWCSTPAIS